MTNGIDRGQVSKNITHKTVYQTKENTQLYIKQKRIPAVLSSTSPLIPWHRYATDAKRQLWSAGTLCRMMSTLMSTNVAARQHSAKELVHTVYTTRSREGGIVPTVGRSTATYGPSPTCKLHIHNH